MRDGQFKGIIWGILLFMAVFSVVAPSGVAIEAEAFEGDWKGQIELPGMMLDILVTFKTPDNLSGEIDIPAQNAKDLPLTDIELAGESIAFGISGVPGDPRFEGEFDAAARTLSGEFSQAGQSYPFSLTRVDQAEQAEEAAETAAALTEDLDSIRVFIETERQRWNVPGVAVAIVKNDSVVFAEGFGYRNLKDSLPVTANTLFAIGSSTKAFTTTMLGTLVDDGALDWDKPVRSYLPAFEMWDDFATERMTPRDLVTHRSGLPRHDAMWYNSNLSRAEIVARLKYLEPNEDFRTTFQYQNLMFLTAGYLAEQVTGKSYETLITERLFQPLGMTNSNFSVLESQQSSDHALPYQEVEDTIALMDFRDITTVGPAGSINSSVNDMTRWVRLQLGGGTIDDVEVIASATLGGLHAPQMAIPQMSSQEEMPYMSYAMGWFVQPYRGHAQVHHGGNIDGFSALVSFFPNDDFGLVVLTNKNATPLPTFVVRYAADRFFDLETIDWSERAKGQQDQMAEVGEEAEAAADETRIEDTKPSHKREAYTGEFEHPAYGLLTVTLDDKKLTTRYNDIEAWLEHWHYDVFRAHLEELGDQKMMMTFRTNTEGDIHEVLLPLEPSVSEIIFKRVPDRRLRDPDFLALLTGKYELATQTVTFEIRGDSTLVAILPGQPVYKLLPYQGTTFKLEGLTGFSVEFVGDEEDGFEEARFIQPNGVFKATRMTDNENE